MKQEQMLEALRASEEKLRRQIQLHERLITAIAHDIKSPLKYIIVASKHLQESLEQREGQEDEKRTIRILHEAVDRVYHLTDNLLQYIRLNSRQGEITYEMADLHLLVEEKMTIFSDIAASHGTYIENKVSPGLQLRSNSRLLGVIIHNLLDNASKVTSDGVISIDAQIFGKRIEITVTDNGPGMNKNMADWCNQPWDVSAPLPLSLGSGLPIVKELLQMINGKLLVETATTWGTSIKLIFQVEDAA